MRRPTNKYAINVGYFREDGSAPFDQIPTFLWDVDNKDLAPIRFTDVYPDGFNAADDVVRDWLLLNFDAMGPAAICSEVLVKMDEYEEDGWTRVSPESAPVEACPVDTKNVSAVLQETGLVCYDPYGYCGHMWPCVEIRQAHRDEDLGRVDCALEAIGWRRGSKRDENTEEITYEVVPEDAEDTPDDDDDEGEEYEDGWHGILLSAVYIVEEDYNAQLIVRAGFRVLKHEDTDTIIAQVGYCGMSTEVSRAKAGFLLAVDRGWPVLTKNGWRRPVSPDA